MPKVLVMGSGGREHALAWRLARDIKKENVYLYPGNAGIERSGFPVLPAEARDRDVLAKLISERKIDLVVIGPELLLDDGYSDFLRSKGFDVCAPSKFAAQLETSKVFAKEFLSRHNVPTAKFQVARSPEALEAILNTVAYPTVLKLDGLAAGKGVVLPQNRAEALEFSNRVWQQHEFGPGPQAIVVEDCLPGTEISWIGLCDGKKFIPLPSGTDYKRAHDGNAGPNTGGMGVISPSPYETPELATKIRKTIVRPVLNGFEQENFDYRGALYIGIMISPAGDPYVLEFNTRFGDPETQATLPRVLGNFFEILQSVARGDAPPSIAFDPMHTVYVVAASQGYPGHFEKGKEITDSGTDSEEAWLFYSGASKKGETLITSGGRVLGACGRGKDRAQARLFAYQRLEKVTFEGRFFRTDVGNI